MQTIFFCFLIAAGLIDLAFGICHSTPSTGGVRFDQPIFQISMQDVQWGDGDGNTKLYLRVYYTDAVTGVGTWSDWRRLDTAGCDDFERGDIGYYDDLYDITEPWEAVALYNCGTDAVAISEFTYWDGVSWQDNLIENFCGNVAGPSRKCYAGAVAVDPTTPLCYAGVEEPYYTYVWLENDNKGDCQGLSVQTGSTLTNGEQVGKVFAKSNPGIPICGNEYGAHGDYGYVEQNSVEQQTAASTENLLNEMSVLIGVIALLIVSNTILVCVFVAKSKRKTYNGAKYDPVEIQSS